MIYVENPEDKGEKPQLEQRKCSASGTVYFKKNEIQKYFHLSFSSSPDTWKVETCIFCKFMTTYQLKEKTLEDKKT